jgi:sugar phosphate isomerase/epimerase
MKRTTLIILALFVLGALAAPAIAANRQDFKVIQNAVKQAPAAESGREVKWFKVLITDSRSSEAKVKITLPVALIEAVLACTDGKHFKVDDGECDIDLKAVWSALKKAGPLALVEIEDDGAVIKVWLE